MRTFNIVYEWMVSGEMEVEADTLEEAVEKIDSKSLEELPNEYIDGSFEVREDASDEIEYEEEGGEA